MSPAGVVDRRRVTLRFLAEPTHVNFGGKVHGGAVMKWIDQAGYTCAASWTGTYCVTVYVGAIHFLAPIRVGELVEIRSTVIRTGRTSLDIAIDIYAGDPKSSERRRTGHCVMAFVSLDDGGKPAAVPAWAPVTEIDRTLERYAIRLGEIRRELDVEMDERLAALAKVEAQGNAPVVST